MKLSKTTLKKLLIIFLAGLLVLPISGCWNRRELNNIGILGALGIDVEGDKVIVTAEIIRPKAYGGGGGANKEAFVMEQTEGESLFEALRNTTEKFDRKLFLADCKILIISEAAAKKGLVDSFEFWIRDHESRLYDYVFVVKGAKPSEVMGKAEGIEDIPSIYLSSLAKAQKANSKSITIELLDLIKQYYSIGQQPTCGVLQLTEIKQDDGEGKNAGTEERKNQDKDSQAESSKSKESTSKSTNENDNKSEVITDIQNEVSKKSEILDEGAAVFLRNKLVGFLNGTETRALNFVTNKVASGTIVSKTSDGAQVVEILNTKCKKKVSMHEDGKFTVNLSVKITGSLGEQTGKDVKVKDLTEIDLQKVQQESSEVVKKEIEAVIARTQKEYKSDIFGFGLEVHKKYPEEWKAIQDNWNQIFSETEVKVQVETNIVETGLLRLPTHVLQGKEIREYD